jgi:hypothetical protein
MKKLTILFTTILLISACSQNTDEEASINQQPLVEYTWMKAGPNFTAENLANLIDMWNGMLDDMGCSLNGANILTPEVANEGYDFIWVHLWTSQTARDNCWNDWTGSSYQSDWDEAINGVMSYDLENVYLFKPKVGSTPRKENTSGSFVNTFYFCNFNEGYSEPDLMNYQKDLLSSQQFSDYWWHTLLEPMFEAENQSDFVWLDLWGSSEDKTEDLKIFQATDFPERVTEMFSCNPDADGISFNGTVIRS